MALASMAGCVTAAVAVTPNPDVHRFKAKAKTHKSTVVASATSTQRRQFLTLLAVSSVLRVGSAQAREKKNVPIFGIRKPSPPENVAEETVLPPDRTQSSAAQKNVSGSSSDSSGGILKSPVQKAGATFPPEAGVQAAAVTVAELIGVVVASSVVKKIVAPEG